MAMEWSIMKVKCFPVYINMCLEFILSDYNSHSRMTRLLKSVDLNIDINYRYTYSY